MTLSAYSLCAAAGMLAGGFVAARTLHSDKVVASCMAAATGCLLLCASAVLDATGTMAVLATTGFAIGIGGPSRDMMIKRATPAGATGRVYGMVYSGLDVGFAIAPVAFGMLMDRGLYSLTFFAAAMLMLLSALVALGVGRRIGPPAPG
jgi:predicted MFS family arabinose efflux permease